MSIRFGTLPAEVCEQYLSKGRRVLVEGRLRPDPETFRLAFLPGFDIPHVFRYTVRCPENENVTYDKSPLEDGGSSVMGRTCGGVIWLKM